MNGKLLKILQKQTNKQTQGLVLTKSDNENNSSSS